MKKFISSIHINKYLKKEVYINIPSDISSLIVSMAPLFMLVLFKLSNDVIAPALLFILYTNINPK